MLLLNGKCLKSISQTCEKKSGMSPRLNPSNIRDISFAGYGRDFDVDLKVKEISFY